MEKKWASCVFFGQRALAGNKLEDPEVFRWKVVDIVSLCLFELGDGGAAAEMISRVLEDDQAVQTPGDRKRLEENLVWFQRSPGVSWDMNRIPVWQNVTLSVKQIRDLFALLDWASLQFSWTLDVEGNSAQYPQKLVAFRTLTRFR